MAVWAENEILASTTGSGISPDILHELSQPLRAFYLFHVYFTVRRILYQMGGIQSFSALPGDSTFSQTENKYDSPSYKSSALNSELIQTLTFVSFTDKIMDWVIVMFQGIHNLTRIGYIHQLVLIIQVHRGFLMKEDQQHRLEINISEMNWIILSTNRDRIVSLIGLSPTKLKDSLRRDSHA